MCRTTGDCSGLHLAIEMSLKVLPSDPSVTVANGIGGGDNAGTDRLKARRDISSQASNRSILIHLNTQPYGDGI